MRRAESREFIYWSIDMKLSGGVLVLMSVVIHGNTCVAQSEESPSILAEFALTGLKDSFDPLRTGEYRARGKVEDCISEEELGTTLEVEFHCWFDFDAQKVRMDRTDKSDSEDEVAVYKFSRTPDGNLFWNSRGRNLAIKRPEPANKNSKSFQPVFDVRAMGFCDHANLSTDFQRAFAWFLSEPAKEASVDSGQAYQLKWHRKGTPYAKTMWLDGARGFVPIRYEEKGPLEAEPRLVTQMTWSEVAGVPVPDSFQFTQRIGGKRRVTYHLAFEWESVNQDIPDEVFTWESFELPVGAYVKDLRLGQDNAITVAYIGRTDRGEQAPVPPDTANKRFVYMIWSTIVLLAILLGGFAIQRARRRQA
jgi:hypothetical protein